MKKKHKPLLIIGVVIVLQILWSIFLIAYLNRDYVKTTATVIEMREKSSNCRTGYRSTCDSSKILYPVYEYYDSDGKRYTEDREYQEEIKQNNPLRSIVGRDVGDKVAAHYHKNDPLNVVFISGLSMYAVLWLPVVVGMVPVTIYLLFLCILYVRNQRHA